MRFLNPILLCTFLAACSGGYSDQYESITRKLPNGHYEVTLKGVRGATLEFLREETQARGQELCHGPVLSRGTRVESFYSRPVGTFDRYPRADSFNLTTEMECFREEP